MSKVKLQTLSVECRCWTSDAGRKPKAANEAAVLEVWSSDQTKKLALIQRNASLFGVL